MESGAKPELIFNGDKLLPTGSPQFFQDIHNDIVFAHVYIKDENLHSTITAIKGSQSQFQIGQTTITVSFTGLAVSIINNNWGEVHLYSLMAI